jgi:tetratricopeptide (TPR) repeat protein
MFISQKKSFQSTAIFMTLFLSACSSSSVIRVQSTPAEADISVIDTNGAATVIGKTPLTSSEADIYKNGNQYAQVKIKKEGYAEQEIVLMKSPQGSDTSLTVQLIKEEVNSNKVDQTMTFEKIASSIARANGLLQSKQYDEAEATMLNFSEQYPTVSVGFDYLGNINFLQKRYAKALKYYNRAMNLNPQNTDRKMIIERIQTLVKSQSGDLQ